MPGPKNDLSMKPLTLPLTLLVASFALVMPSAAQDDLKPADWLFYLPTHDEPATPATWGFDYDDVRFQSSDDTPLHGWLIHSRDKSAKGAVIFSHGNAGAIGHHLGFVLWLAEAGYHVLIYDYRGFGKSGGQINRVGMVNDARAAISYASKHPQLKGLPLISYGHSMGGAKSIAAIGDDSPANLRAVIVDASFASYRDIARHIGGRLSSLLVSDTLSPIQLIARISPRPLLVIHGRNDQVVPFSQGLQLYQAAGKPKTLFDVAGGSHGDSLARDRGTYRKRMLEWLDRALTNK